MIIYLSLITSKFHKSNQIKAVTGLKELRTNFCVAGSAALKLNMKAQEVNYDTKLAALGATQPHHHHHFL